MFSRMRGHFSTSALILSVTALVFAMLGGAYAAQSGSGGEATASAKAKKGPRGPRGPKGATGATGAVGANGAAGAVGPAGPAGAQGPAGPAGAKGATGANAEVNEIEIGDVECGGRGGVEVGIENEAGFPVCTGQKGTAGAAGSPWAPENALPSNATETGAWSFTASEVEFILAPLSFTVPLGNELVEEDVHYQGTTEFAESCPGKVSDPEADPGKLCVYFNGFGGGPVNAELIQIGTAANYENPGTSTSGAILWFEFSGATGEEARGNGTWAVTAP